MTEKQVMQVQCRGCGGTGLDEWIKLWRLCDTCKGTGAEAIEYMPYSGRVHHEGAPAVMIRTRGYSEGEWIDPEFVSYDEFLTRIPEAPIEQNV